jgi:hypothetical protein
MFHHLAIRMKKAAADPELGEQYLAAAKFLFQRDESSPVASEQPAQAAASIAPVETPNPR